MDNQNQDQANEIIYAGKFKTVEELENGYKNAAGVFNENETLKKKLSEFTSVPEDYQRPMDVELPDDYIQDIKTLAKNAGLTQTQFEKLARESKERTEAQKVKFNEAQKELGEDNLNILKDYVKKYYPEKVGDAILKTLITDKEARAAAMAHRQVLLNNTVPGVGAVTVGGYRVTREDVLKQRAELQKRPHDLKARDKYINLMSQYADQKDA
jgi:hypothetical protein